MYVCVCNAVTDRQIRSQSECGRGTVAEIYRALGITVKCGKCVRTAKCIINDAQAEAGASALCPAFAAANPIPSFAVANPMPSLAAANPMNEPDRPQVRSIAPMAALAMAE
ncbi:MAG TPA: (2Fe-2S)-binding protein [Candidatus Binataceae bacterium]|jgi:bacterioferritin-associated ferredoxin